MAAAAGEFLVDVATYWHSAATRFPYVLCWNAPAADI